MDRPFSAERGHGDEIPVTQHGILTASAMQDMLRPGALDASAVQGHRIRWAYRTTPGGSVESKRISEELKQRHLELGAREVIVYCATWLKDE